MSSSNPPFRQRKKPDPVDAMLDEWEQIRAGERRKPEEQSLGKLPAMSQLELLMLLLKRP